VELVVAAEAAVQEESAAAAPESAMVSAVPASAGRAMEWAARD
jgi:hypothetical protein